MKTKVIASLLSLLLSVSLGFAQSKFVPEDDIYYQPKASNKVIESKKNASHSTSTGSQYNTPTQPNTSKGITSSTYRNEDEYNRRYEHSDYYIQDSTSDQKPQDQQVSEDSGYYLNGFNGNASDYEYAERIRKFHNPKFTIHISDPDYNDIYFLNSSDWNVYIDNSYAWVTPTWTNPWSWNYMWTPYSYTSLSWRWNWGYSSWGLYGGWNSYWDPFWGGRPYWGYNPHYPYWGHHPSWGYPHGGFYPGISRPNYRPNRPGDSSPRNPYYGRGNSYNDRNRRPGSTVITKPSTSRPGDGISTPGVSNNRPDGSAPSTGTNVRPSGNTRPGGNTSRPTGTTRPNGNISNGNNNGNYTRPSSEHATTVTRPSGNSSTNVTRPTGNTRTRSTNSSTTVRSSNDRSSNNSSRGTTRSSEYNSSSQSRPSSSYGSSSRSSGSSSGRSSGSSHSSSSSSSRGGRR